MKTGRLIVSCVVGLAAFLGQVQAGCVEDCDEAKILVAAEFLWWTSGNYYPFANNVFNNDGNAVGSESAPFPSITDTTLDPYVRISEKWSPGLRLGLGWENDEGDWQVWGVWTGFSNYARRKIESAPPPPPLDVEIVSAANNGFLTPPVGAGVLSNTNRASAVTATHKLNYNVADLVVGNRFCDCWGVQLMPYVGVRAAFINQRDRVFFNGISREVGRTGFDAFIGGSSKVEEQLWCVGPRLGLQASWGQWCGFSLLGNLSGAILYGRLEEYVTTSQFTPVLQPNRVFAIVTQNVNTYDRYNQIVANLQVQLGFSYSVEFDICCRPYAVDLFALWDGNRYWGASNVLLFERGLGLNGLTTGFTFSW